jgi:tetratricopeptide (TPR) repeat protein
MALAQGRFHPIGSGFRFRHDESIDHPHRIRVGRDSRDPSLRAWMTAAALALTLGVLVVAPARSETPTTVSSTAGSPSPASVRALEPEALPGAPTTFNDLSGWLDYKTRNHIAALPQEARLFFRRGLMARQSGSREEAIRLVRGASNLDPSFVAPRLTLASWFLLGEPSQALLQYAAVLEMARQNFVLQLAVVANSLYLALQALFLGLLAAGFLIVCIRNRELRHRWHEGLSHFVSPVTARWWSWSFAILPFLSGFGISLPTVAFLGLLWPSLRVRERAVFVALVALLAGAPWIASSMDRLSTPLREDRGPLYGVGLVEGEPYRTERQNRFATLATQHPSDPYVHFGLAWIARRGGDLATAERAYRRALELWPTNDRVMNNLGNTLAMKSRQDEALELYRRATNTNPSNAAAWFNASQIYTQRFEYRAATDALSRASALNFDMVKSYQTDASNDGLLPLVDQWMSPITLWSALRSAEAPSSPSLPPAWRGLRECSGVLFSGVIAAIALLSVALSIWQQRKVPLRTCSNCGSVVCRRCAQRRRELALCADCATIESRAESPDFARVLLAQRSRKVNGAVHLFRTALSTLIPGFGLLCFQRLFTPIVLLSGTAALAARLFGITEPFAFEPRLTVGNSEVPVPVLIGLWALIYAISIIGYFGRVAHEKAVAASNAAPARPSRVTQANRHTAEAA